MLLHKTAHTEENSRYLQACVLWVSDELTYVLTRMYCNMAPYFFGKKSSVL